MIKPDPSGISLVQPWKPKTFRQPTSTTWTVYATTIHGLTIPGGRAVHEPLTKSPSGAAVRYALNQWQALTRFLLDGELEIDNGATEPANRDIALGRGNWTFFGSDNGGKTAAVLRSFIASCKRCGVEPFAWFHDVLSRVPAHSITRLHERRGGLWRCARREVVLLPHNWKRTAWPVQA